MRTRVLCVISPLWVGCVLCNACNCQMLEWQRGMPLFGGQLDSFSFFGSETGAGLNVVNADQNGMLGLYRLHCLGLLATG